MVHGHGHWGSEGEKFLHYIAKTSRNDQGKKNEADFCRYWRRCVSVSLQKCNSRLLLKNGVVFLSLGKIGIKTSQTETFIALFTSDNTLQ